MSKHSDEFRDKYWIFLSKKIVNAQFLGIKLFP